MKIRCCWFQIWLLWVVMLPAAVQAQFNYVTTNGIVAITAYTGAAGALVIPSTINGLPVTIIGTNAFQNCGTIVTVTVPSSVTNMGMNAFVNCPSLTRLYFLGNAPSLKLNTSLFSQGPSVVTIFYWPGTSGWSSTYSGRPAVMFHPPTPAGSFEVDFLPAAVVTNGARWQVDGGVVQTNGALVKGLSVGTHTLSFSSLNGWAMPPNQTVVVSANSNAYTSAAYCRLIYTNNNGAITITGYTNAGSGAVVLPDTIDGLPVTSIGTNAFQNYTGLTNVTIPGSVTNVGKNAFFGCTGLKAVYFQGNAPLFDPSSPIVFSGVPAIYYPPGTSGWSSYFALCPTTMLNPPTPAGSLKVNTSPQAVITNAQWQVDGGVMQPAGATVSGLSVGNHIVSFKPFNGWAIPAAQIVAVSSNATTTVTGTYGQLVWTTNNGAITITGNTGSASDIVLPDTINGLQVVAIQGAAFQSRPSLVSVMIPNSITNIGSHALANCSSLTSVYFQGNNPPALGSGVFENDANVTVYYPPGTSGWSSPFGGAPAAMLNPPSPSGSLQITFTPTSITNSAQWRVDGGPAQFSGAIVSGLSVGNHTVSFDPASGGWAMPAEKVVAVSADSTNTASGVDTPLSYATNNGAIIITGYNSLTPGIVLPSTINGLPVVAIQGLAFQFRLGLTNITIPNSVTNIGSQAFYNCLNLVSVTIGSGLTGIDPDAFNFCTNLTAITVDTNNPVYSSVGGIVFDKYQTALIQFPPGGRTCTIPDSVAYVARGAFQNCFGLTNVTIGTNVTTIGDNAFLGCSRLKSLTIPNSVFTIGSDAFRNCSGLTNVIIGSSVNMILYRAFQGCSGLTTITIPGSVSLIWADAFTSCSSLTGIYFQGDAPYTHGDMVAGDNHATVYYLPWTARWGQPGTPYSGCPTALWLPQAQTSDGSFGVRTNQFGFNITWGGDMDVVVEACTDLANPVWTPVSTNTLVGGTTYFSDPDWTNYPGRFYRVHSALSF